MPGVRRWWSQPRMPSIVSVASSQPLFANNPWDRGRDWYRDACTENYLDVHSRMPSIVSVASSQPLFADNPWKRASQAKNSILLQDGGAPPCEGGAYIDAPNPPTNISLVRALPQPRSIQPIRFRAAEGPR